jgi:membrane protease YdiL (CAAX protease family)
VNKPIAAAPTPPADDRLAASLRGFGPRGILALAVIALLGPILEPLAGILVLWWAQRSRTPWRELGFVRPKSWVATLALGIAVGCILKLFVKAVAMPLLGAPAINVAYQHLVGNPAALPLIFFQSIVGAGFGEETVYRGFLFERLGKLFGSGAGARVAIVVLTSALFGAIHYPVQGFAGVEQALMTGVVFGTIFAFTRRIWLLMVAHAAYDVVAILIIFWNLESSVAHLLFK